MMNTLPRSLVCLTLAHVIDEPETVEALLREDVTTVESCIPLALRDMLNSQPTAEYIKPMTLPSASDALKYLTVLWSPGTIDSKLLPAHRENLYHLVPYFIAHADKDMYFYVPFMAMAELGNIAMVKYLKPKLYQFDRQNALNALARNPACQPEIIRLLATRDMVLDSALVGTAQFGCPEVINVLIAGGAVAETRKGSAPSTLSVLGADVHAYADEPLIRAVSAGKLENVKVLLDAGADIHARSNAPLTAAASGGHVDVVRYLLHFAKLQGNEMSENAVENALRQAASSDSDTNEVVKLLLSTGRVDQAHMNTALLDVLRYGKDSRNVKTLLDAGADIQRVTESIYDGRLLISVISPEMTEVLSGYGLNLT